MPLHPKHTTGKSETKPQVLLPHHLCFLEGATGWTWTLGTVFERFMSYFFHGLIINHKWGYRILFSRDMAATQQKTWILLAGCQKLILRNKRFTLGSSNLTYQKRHVLTCYTIYYNLEEKIILGFIKYLGQLWLIKYLGQLWLIKYLGGFLFLWNMLDTRSRFISSQSSSLRCPIFGGINIRWPAIIGNLW